MVDFREDVNIYPSMIELSACLCNEIAASGLPTPCSCGPIVGELVLDYCGTCADGKCGGQAWVRLLSAFPTTGLPNTVVTPRNCFSPIGFTLEMGIVRCKPVGTASGVRGYVPPTLQQQVDALRLQTADIAAMVRAVQCCFGNDDERDYILGTYTPTVPGGDCLGGAFTITIASGY